jgi:hypothetical protein
LSNRPLSTKGGLRLYIQTFWQCPQLRSSSLSCSTPDPARTGRRLRFRTGHRLHRLPEAMARL